MFHLKEGWFFERLPEGKVRILKRESASDEAPIVMEVVVDKPGWCSVISSVSAEGETSRKYDEAVEFHG